jgi:trimethylamine:corrinoid methyltransferase-like protein
VQEKLNGSMFPLTGHRNALSEERLEGIHQAALHLAEDIGLPVSNDKLIGRLVGRDGIRIMGQRVYFCVEIIEQALLAMRFPPVPYPERFNVISGAYVISTQDLDTGQVRESTLQDLINLTILGEQLGMVGSPVVRPLDLPLPLQEIAMYKTTWEFSKTRPEPLFDTTPMSSIAAAETIYEMAQSIGKPFSVGMYLISPFRCPPEGLEVIAAFLDRNVPMWIGTMPVAGLTAPIFLLGAHVQALAELMAGAALLYTLTENQVPFYWTPIDSVRAHPFDMRYATFVYGSPEDVVGTILQAQINRRYLCPLIAKSLLTTAREPDEQAAAEKASHTLLAALAGFRIFTNGGFLATDEYISPLQMVIDREIVNYVSMVVKGIVDDDTALALDAIHEVVGAGSSFIEHESTLRNFRESAWDPLLFSHIGLKAAPMESRERPLAVRALEKAKQHIAAGDYILPESDRRILDSIYQRADHRLA